MRILYIAHRIPFPPNKGDKIRSFNEIKYLSKRHEIHLACLIDNDKDVEHVKILEKYCSSVNAVKIDKRLAKMRSLLSLTSNRPFSLAYFFSRDLKRKIALLLNEHKFDLILVFSSSMAQYVIDSEGIARVMDFVDADSFKWLQYATYTKFPLSAIYKIESKRLGNYENEIIEGFRHCIVITEKELEVLKNNSNKDKLSVISNGVDLDYFFFRTDECDPNTIVFIGAMDYFANIDGVMYFYEEIYPYIRKQIPEVKFYIVGNNPSKEILKLNGLNGVIVTGFVKDIRPYISKAAVSVVPLRIARGIQNKVLEAMAMGVPLITTPQALEGIQAQTGRDVIMESKPEEFAKKVVEIIKDRKLQKLLSGNGRLLVEKKYNWDINMGKLENLLEESIKQS